VVNKKLPSTVSAVLFKNVPGPLFSVLSFIDKKISPGLPGLIPFEATAVRGFEPGRRLRWRRTEEFDVGAGPYLQADRSIELPRKFPG
jgi:hypothetical protein